MAADESDRSVDAEKIVSQHWPQSGPYDSVHTVEAARAILELANYLRSATEQGNGLSSVLVGADTLRRLDAGARGVCQIYSNLADFYARRATDPGLHHERPDRNGGEAARQIADVLNEFSQSLHGLFDHEFLVSMGQAKRDADSLWDSEADYRSYRDLVRRNSGGTVGVSSRRS